jgi:hypothetical protein
MLWSKPPVASGDHHLPAAMLHDRAADAVTVAVKAQQGGIGPHRDTRAQHAREQTGRQALSTRGVTSAQHPAAHTLCQSLAERRNSLARQPSHQIHPAVVGTRRRDRDADLHQARLQPGAVVAENRRVERVTFARAACRAATGLLGVVIGIVACPKEPQGSRPAQHLDRRGHVRQECRRASPGRRARDHGVEVGSGALLGVSGAPQNRARGQPQRSAGASGRAAHVRRFLHDQHRQPEFIGGQRRGHPGARAHDQQVDAGVGHGMPGRDRRAVRYHAENRMPGRRDAGIAVLMSGTTRPQRRVFGS